MDLPDPSPTPSGLAAARAAAERPTLGSLLPAAAVACLALLGLAVLNLMPGKAASGRYIVIAAPVFDRRPVAELIHDAGAGVVAVGMLPGVAVAWSDDPGFAEAARARGAWLVAPTSAFAGCGVSNGKVAE